MTGLTMVCTSYTHAGSKLGWFSAIFWLPSNYRTLHVRWLSKRKLPLEAIKGSCRTSTASGKQTPLRRHHLSNLRNHLNFGVMPPFTTHFHQPHAQARVLISYIAFSQIYQKKDKKKVKTATTKSKNARDPPKVGGIARRVNQFVVFRFMPRLV